jgi:hypothetical protein
MVTAEERERWEKLKRLKARKDAELAVLDVEIASHKADSALLYATMESLMAGEDAANHQRTASRRASLHEESNTHASQSLVQKSTAVESELESSHEGSGADRSTSMPKKAAGREVEQVAPEQRQKKVSSRPIHSGAARPNPLKGRIANLRRQYQRQSHRARAVCMALDKNLERGFNDYKPLDSWQKKAGGKRSWIDLFNDPRTHNDVKTFINRILPSRY